MYLVHCTIAVLLLLHSAKAQNYLAHDLAKRGDSDQWRQLNAFYIVEGQSSAEIGPAQYLPICPLGIDGIQATVKDQNPLQLVIDYGITKLDVYRQSTQGAAYATGAVICKNQ